MPKIAIAGYRFILLLLHLFLGVILTAWFRWVKRLNFNQKPYRETIQWWLNRITAILGINVVIKGQLADAPVLIVANHISWLDIPLLAGVANPRFLSKSDVRHWPVIGWLAATSGTLFIERGKASATEAAKQAINLAMHEQSRVMIFPEGTTTDGKSIRRFHARLFASAIESDVPVQPVAVCYCDAQGNRHQEIPYINDQSLMGNLLSIIGGRGITAEVNLLDPIKLDNPSRKALALAAENAVGSVVSTRWGEEGTRM